jgi:hypothetical protein
MKSSSATYLTFSRSPSLSVASIATASMKTIGPSFKPCEDQSTSEGKKATNSAESFATRRFWKMCRAHKKMIGAVAAPITALTN